MATIGAVLVAMAVTLAVAGGVFALSRRRLLARLHELERVAAESDEALSHEGSDMARLGEALDQLPHGVCVCDERGVVVFTNAAGALFAGARHGEALVAAAVREALGAALQGELEDRVVELFGPPARTVSVTAAPLGPSDDRTGAVAVVADISRVRRLESVRRDFVANMSHELKTPVGGLSLLADAITEASDADERARLAQRMQREAERVGSLIDDLLSLSEIESDDEPSRVPIELGHVVAKAVVRVQPLARRYGVDIDVMGADAVWTTGDHAQIVSAVANLLENAIKYSDGNSPVTLEVTAGDDASVAVADRGIGIPAWDLERVFERFYRVDRARSRETGGTGLGLAIVRNVARAHGGEVSVESEEGVGSTFVLRLPIAAPSVMAAQEDVVTEPSASPRGLRGRGTQKEAS